MRIGVLADTHLREVTPFLEAIYARFLKDMDLILHAGDITSSKIILFLRQRPFAGVHGNMDGPEVRRALPSKQVIEVAGLRLGLIHGWGAPEGLEARVASQFEEVDIIVFGHSHQFGQRRLGRTLLFNPGTASGFSPTGKHTLGILEIGTEGEVRGDFFML